MPRTVQKVPVAVDGDGQYELLCFDVDPVDATASGDTFCGAFGVV